MREKLKENVAFTVAISTQPTVTQRCYVEILCDECHRNSVKSRWRKSLTP
jgi:hypothetical protein